MKKNALAAAVITFFALCGSNAAALSLGRVHVQSALGEPLRAEIDIPEINADEAASLKLQVALPEAFRAAGLEYNAAMPGLHPTLQKRPDGRTYIRLIGDRSINDPFVDMLFEAHWASGRIVRDYTMLFAPPSLRQTTSATPTPAQVPAPSPVAQAAAPAVQLSMTTPPPALTSIRPTESAKSSAKTNTHATTAKTTSAQNVRIAIKSGDTASKIAATALPANVSLDQMLVALLRANPTAFMGDNINRIKAGVVVNIPTTAQAEASSASEASQIIYAQSKDFNDFRRKLASLAPSTTVATADRKASGSVQTQVEDKKVVAPTPDKLTLSKGAIQGQSAEDQLAKERNAQELAKRANEITKNLSDLGKLGTASSVIAPAAGASATSGGLTSPSIVTATTTLPEQAASASATASAPKAAVSARVKPPMVAPVPLPEPSLVDGLLENPILPAGAGGLIVLLAGWGLYRYRQQKKTSQDDSSFLESHLQPDSFFGASGGQNVDTHDNNAATDSSLAYSPSQNDPVEDVDPIAEADVYLAYGRDLQAEEILRDALQTSPERIAIHHKLLEILAKRLDTQSFAAMAAQAFKITNGDGADWQRICELGLSIDPDNALYQPGGQPILDNITTSPAPLEDTSSLTPSEVAIESAEGEPASHDAMDLDLDLDLDFSLDEEPAPANTEEVADSAELAPPSLDLDFGLATQAMSPFEAPENEVAQEISNEIEFSLPDLEVKNTDPIESTPDSDEFEPPENPVLDAPSVEPLDIPESETPSAPDLGMLEFDLGDLSLDLDEMPEPALTSGFGAHEDPLATKLALAEEFSAIGDDDGARALIEEVLAEATGDMKIKAQRALSNL